jgi:2OG-Fe(II) oxygenase superfamily
MAIMKTVIKETVNERLIYTDSLSHDHIKQLANNEKLAVIVTSYAALETCALLNDRILSLERAERYTHELIDGGRMLQKYFGVDRIGIPFNSTYFAEENSLAKHMYYDGVAESFVTLRKLASPFLFPTEQLQIDLNSCFQYGAEIATFEYRSMRAGILRLMRSEFSHLGAEQPHFDALPSKYCRLDAQLAANIYLKTPSIGGELEIWDVPPLEPLGEAPLNWRSKLPVPTKLSPHMGDLIIFNCRKPHAVRAFEGEPRISAQMFIGYQEGRALQLWN